MTAASGKEFSLIDLVLADQRDMSAVDRFSSLHERSPRTEASYRNLIPLSRPKSGEQYAFVVDLDRCSGCKACVSACHSLNGLDEGEMWRSVGTIVGEESPYLQTITSSCHHCVDPACASGCPVLAYEKDADTGIVRHLDDQCIGCQYCVLKCPYDVPKYSRRKGIVRKCDMCHSRLAVGEAPACAQACPHEAIRIEIVSQNEMRVAGGQPGAQMIPGAFRSSYTLPTTKYESTKDLPVIPAASSYRLEHAHWPLILMLILTQLSVGLHLVMGALLISHRNAPCQLLSIAAAIALGSGLVVSIFHLGRPLKAWRAFLGWRRSWMSREILAFSAYAAMALALVAFPQNGFVTLGAVLIGLFSVACSAMIYVDTRRTGWSADIVFPSFFGTAALLGPTLAGALCGWIAPLLAPALAVAATTVRTSLFGWKQSSLSLTNAVALRLAPSALRGNLVLFLVSTVFSILAIVNLGNVGFLWGSIACISTITAQLIDRYLFFVATPAPRMPASYST